MSACCSGFGDAAEHHFTEAIASRDLARYRENGPGKTARLLVEGLAGAGAPGNTLLDVGSGIGTMAFELLARGMTRAVLVDASSAYLAAAADEAARRQCQRATQFVHGDFLDVASELRSADLVTLDRVICCYPSYEPLLRECLGHAEHYLALSYPRDVWYVRCGITLENRLRWLRRNPFRTFVHASSAVERLIDRAGFELASRRQTWMWAADVYIRRSPS